MAAHAARTHAVRMVVSGVGGDARRSSPAPFYKAGPSAVGNDGLRWAGVRDQCKSLDDDVCGRRFLLGGVLSSSPTRLVFAGENLPMMGS